MAKKITKTLKKGSSVQYTKMVRMVKSEKTGAYIFEEKVMNKDRVNNFFKS